MQHMVLSLSSRVRGGLSVHSVPPRTLVKNESNICCMYTVYAPEDEHLRLETCRGT
jgi:hypothetical protein